MVQTVSPHRAMILAAGLGTRMRPLTEDCPKPLLRVKDQALLGHCLDHLKTIGVREVVINVHYLHEDVINFVSCYPQPKDMVIYLLHETVLLDTGGGVRNALLFFLKDPFYVVNADNYWQPVPEDPLLRLAENWDDGAMDALLSLVPLAEAHYYEGHGDFVMHADGRLSRYYPTLKPDEIWVFTGLQILHPRLFHGTDAEVFSLNRLYNKALMKNRLYGCPFGGKWWHVGTPEALEGVNQMEE